MSPFMNDVTNRCITGSTSHFLSANPVRDIDIIVCKVVAIGRISTYV